MKFAKTCPKCGGNVQTKSIRKSIGLGFVNIPVAQFCLNPSCDWYQDFSEAKKPQELEETVLQVKIPVSKDRMAEIKKMLPGMIQRNMMVVKGAIIVFVLSLLFMFLLQFVIQPPPPQPESPGTGAPAVTAAATSAVPTTTPAVMQVVSKKYPVKIDVTHGFSPNVVVINNSDTVLWSNEENQRPRVGLISKDGLFKNKLMEYSDKYQYQFNQSGNYTFVLAEYDPIKRTFNEYPNATGNVVVK